MANMRLYSEKTATGGDIGIVNTALPHNFISGVRKTLKIAMLGHVTIIIDPVLRHRCFIAADQRRRIRHAADSACI